MPTSLVKFNIYIYMRIVVYIFSLISIGSSLSDKANKMKFLSLTILVISENLSPIYQIGTLISEDGSKAVVPFVNDR